MSPQQDFKHGAPSFGDLIGQQGRCFYVPMYQRDFTWGSDQIERLFEDLFSGIDRVASGDNPSTFLGSVIFFDDRYAVDPGKDNALPTSVFHVVDGQQRLTTLLLLCSSLMREVHQVLAELEATQVLDSNPDPTTTWLSEILQTVSDRLLGALHWDHGQGDNGYRFKPRMIRQASDTWGNTMTDARYESDIAYYLHEIAKSRAQTSAHGPVIAPPSRPHLKLALDAIESTLARVQTEDIGCAALWELDFVSNVEACGRLLGRREQAPVEASSFSQFQLRGARLATIASFLFGHVKVIEVIAPTEEYAFTLFEPLNSTGQPLTPIETLKPLVVQAEGGGSNFLGSPSEEHLRAVDRYLPEDLEPAQRTRRLNSLITSFALVERGEKIGRVLLEQRSFLRQSYGSVAGMDLQTKRAFSEGLATTANFLNDYWDDDSPSMALLGDERTHLCLKVLTATRHTISIPLLVRYYERAEKTKADSHIKEFQHVLRSVTAFWTLWRTARTTTSGIDTEHRRLIGEGDAETGLPCLTRAEMSHEDLPKADEVRNALKGTLVRKLKISSAEDWINKVGAQSVYQTEKVLARYLLLLAHDDAIKLPDSPRQCRRGASGCAPTLNVATWKAHYTIEHMAPQSINSADTSYERAIYDDGLIDRLGNLLLPRRSSPARACATVDE
ncbi:MAG: DUF262 domain-containing protein [Acidimicrobiaceae bacterium]|nr:DUF262 domain-containing protein [Acidimicrobiaceae bacterium]MYG56527.1 DUF262 domain-containing protein [Acidimicrobiaceae bacterium]MYJ97510.1 DUF262 domain-containing protein [Acidimicrobiaceae bacterium]